MVVVIVIVKMMHAEDNDCDGCGDFGDSHPEYSRWKCRRIRLDRLGLNVATYLEDQQTC